jgi:hypothetical protein
MIYVNNMYEAYQNEALLINNIKAYSVWIHLHAINFQIFAITQYEPV